MYREKQAVNYGMDTERQTVNYSIDAMAESILKDGRDFSTPETVCIFDALFVANAGTARERSQFRRALSRNNFPQARNIAYEVAHRVQDSEK